MSREVIIRIRDDIDGSDADETIVFSVRGQTYEVDLSAANVELFDKSLAEWLKVARKADPPKRRKKAAAKSVTAQEPVPLVPPLHNAAVDPAGNRLTPAQRAEVRAWGIANGYPQRTTGRITREVLNAWFGGKRGR